MLRVFFIKSDSKSLSALEIFSGGVSRLRVLKRVVKCAYLVLGLSVPTNIDST